MTTYHAGSCEVAVIGAGHAGIEAALACARLGHKTILFTINLDAVANLPCNPAIGGTGKGHLVRELDALGGQMGIAADHCCIQYRMLNRGKGLAVHSLRAQADRRAYQNYMKHVIERTDNLELKQAMIVSIDVENGAVTGLNTMLGAHYDAKAVIIASGTYLDSTVITGDCVYPPAPTACTPPLVWRKICGSWVCPCGGSGPAPRPASTAGAWIFPKWSCSPAMKIPSPSLSGRPIS